MTYSLLHDPEFDVSFGRIEVASCSDSHFVLVATLGYIIDGADYPPRDRFDCGLTEVVAFAILIP